MSRSQWEVGITIDATHVSGLLSSSNLLLTKYRLQHPQVAIAEDAAEALFGVEEGRRHPALDHFAVPPASHASALAPRGGVGILNDVSAAQRATQRG